MIIPHGPVRVGHRGPAGRIVDERRVFVDQPAHLLRVEQQVDDLPQAVLVLDADRAVLEDAGPAERVGDLLAAVVAADIVGGPAQIDVPGEQPPLIRLGVVIEEPVLLGDVSVVDGVLDRIVRVVAVEMDILPPPGLGRIAVGAEELPQVGPIGRLPGTLVVEVVHLVVHLEEIAVGQIVLVEELAVDLLHGQIQPPEIAVVLRAARRQRRVGGIQRPVFEWLVDNPKVHVVRVRRGAAGHVEHPESEGLEHALLAALPEVALLDAGREVQLVPGGIVGPSVVIARLEIVPPAEIDFEHGLAHRVPPDAAAGAVADVVVDLAVVDDGPVPA